MSDGRDPANARSASPTTAGIAQETKLRGLPHLWSAFRGSRRAILVLAILSLIVGGLESLLLILLVPLGLAVTAGQTRVSFDVLPGSSPTADAATSAAGIATGTAIWIGIGLVLVRLVFEMLRMNAAANLVSTQERTIRTRILHAFFRADWRERSKETAGQLQAMLTTSVDRVVGLYMATEGSIRLAVFAAAMIFAALLVAPLEATAALGLGIAIFFAVRPIGRIMQRTSRGSLPVFAALSNQINEGVALGRDAMVYDVEEPMFERVAGPIREASEVRRRIIWFTEASQSIFISAIFATAFAGLAVITQVSDAGVAVLGSVVLLLFRSLNYASALQRGIHAIYQYLPYLDQCHAIIAHLESTPRADGDRGVPGDASAGRIEFDNVSFAYRADTPVLKGLTATIEPGEAIGIVGPSGAGKSTLTHLLLRLYEPTGGAIRIGGEPLSDLRRADWYRTLAYVPQEPVLMDDTVGANIGFLRDAEGIATEDRLAEAARRAHLTADLARWPEGLATRTGERGQGLSGGQRQRVAIARALLGKPSIVLLDEPTSALDAESEAAVQATLRELHADGEATLLIVSHHLSTLRVCDRLLVLRDGEVEAFDSLEVLAATNPFVKRMVAQQQD